jgi:hypothetical protein
MKPDGKDDCFVAMGFSDGKEHLTFWCPNYNPYRVYLPKEQYFKGEETCLGCSLPDRGVMYRAMFQCSRVASPMLLTGYAYERGNRFWNISHGVPRGAEARMLTDMMEWLNGRESKAKRKPAKKTSKASKERDDIHGTDYRTPAGLLQDNPVRTEVVVVAQEIRQSQGEQGNDSISRTPEGGGLQGMPEGNGVRQELRVLHGTNNGASLQAVWTESNVPMDREHPVDCLRAVYEPAMSVEYDESYNHTTVHACITCKCGKKVWYGCGKKQLTRPKFCKACTEVEMNKLKEHLPHLDDLRMQEIFIKELRREILR